VTRSGSARAQARRHRNGLRRDFSRGSTMSIAGSTAVSKTRHSGADIGRSAFAGNPGNGSSCKGFRMTAPSRAYRRAPGPSSESLQGRNPRDAGRNAAAGYGDFGTAVEDAAADDVAGGVMVEPRGGGDEARVARQQGSEADLGLAGCWHGRALSRPVLDQRDRSAQRRLPGLMRCRSRWRRASRSACVAQARLR
jgi:hypothetical protein